MRRLFHLYHHLSPVIVSGRPLAFNWESPTPMKLTPEDIIEAILSNGPFSKDLVESWPEDLRKDYFELMALDLQNLGPEEFKRQSRFIGETYLLSHGKSIRSSSVLLNAWLTLTDCEPPETLVFGLNIRTD